MAELLSIIYIIVMMLFLFGITIFVHEFGHFIVARWCGLVVETFSIGMGPALWKKTIGGIVYKIGAFPIGGYVALPQLDPEGMEKMQGENENDRKSLPSVSPWKKIAVSVAGPLSNILFAIPLALIVTTAEQPTANTIIGYVATNGTAYAAGIVAGDEILELNGTPVNDWYSILVEDHMAQGSQTIEMKIRSGETTTKAVSLPANEEIGISEAIRPLLAQITPNEPAERGGLKTGDLITEINGKPIKWWHELSDEVQKNKDKAVSVKVLRDGNTINLTVTPKYNETYEKVMIGVTPGDQSMIPWSMAGNPIAQIKDDASKIFRLLKALTTKREAKQAAKGLGGPVAIFTMIWFAMKLGLVYAIGLIRFLNVNLAVLNLLPIPVLDGGHICFALWEGITRRKVHPKIVTSLINVFAILLIGAMLILTWRDVDRNWSVSRFFKKAPAAQAETTAPVEPAE